VLLFVVSVLVVMLGLVAEGIAVLQVSIYKERVKDDSERR
jgi:hypothetical protein